MSAACTTSQAVQTQAAVLAADAFAAVLEAIPDNDIFGAAADSLRASCRGQASGLVFTVLEEEDYY